MTYQWVCDDVPTIAFADFVVDGRYDYEIDVLSGFPDDTQSKKTHPEYRTKYKWSDSDLISIGRDNCLYANSLAPTPLFSPFYVYQIWDQASAH